MMFGRLLLIYYTVQPPGPPWSSCHNNWLLWMSAIIIQAEIDATSKKTLTNSCCRLLAIGPDWLKPQGHHTFHLYYHENKLVALLMPRSHQRFLPVPTVTLLGIMLRNRCWPTTFHIITVEDGNKGCLDSPVWSTPRHQTVAPWGEEFSEHNVFQLHGYVPWE